MEAGVFFFFTMKLSYIGRSGALGAWAADRKFEIVRRKVAGGMLQFNQSRLQGVKQGSKAWKVVWFVARQSGG